MLKIRLQGTKKDIKWFRKILERHPKVSVLEISDYYQNKGTLRYYRVYAEISKKEMNKKQEEKDHDKSNCSWK